MPPFLDVYVWVPVERRVSALASFLDHYVDTNQPGDPRYLALRRTWVDQRPAPGDEEALAELMRDQLAVKAFTMYLRAKVSGGAVVTLTEEGDLVLGLGLDCPECLDPESETLTVGQARDVLRRLLDEFAATAGLAGFELPPPQSIREWRAATSTILRVGEL